jgi:hypothetical protein
MQLEAELADLHAELACAVRNKNVTEEEYLQQIIAVSQPWGHQAANYRCSYPHDVTPLLDTKF